MRIFAWIICLGCIFLLAKGCNQHSPESYKIGRDPTWAFSPFDGITENVNAFTNALINQMSKEGDISLEIVDVGPLNLLPWLDEGKYSAILASLPLTLENLDKYQFSDSILMLGPVLVVKASSSAHSLEDLKNKIVGIYELDDTILTVQKFPNILIQSYESIPQILDEVASGTIDGAVIPSVDAHLLVPTRYSGILRIASPPLTEKGIRLITLKGKNTSLFTLFDSSIKKMKKSGLFLLLRSKFIF